MKKLNEMEVGEIIYKPRREVSASIDKLSLRFKGNEVRKGEVVTLSTSKVSIEGFKVLRILDGDFVVLKKLESKGKLSSIDLFFLLKQLLLKGSF